MHINAGDFVYRKLEVKREEFSKQVEGYEHVCPRFEDIPQPNKLEICTEVTTSNVESPYTEIGSTLIAIRGVYYRADEFLPYLP